MKIEFYKHNLSEIDRQECHNVLNTLFLTTGEQVKLFEEKLAAYTGNKHGIGVTSCTSALFLSLKYFGVKEGDEIITTPLSFIATANVIEHCGAKPVFVDVEPETGNIDANLIERAITPATKGILPVHLYGQMCDMKKIKEIADRHKLFIIEDSAHCIEGMRDGIRPGQLSATACFSFYATKNITCGEGGAIVCNDDIMCEWLKKARLHGMSKNAIDRYTGKYEHYDMEFLGYKYNMNNIQASLLIHQLSEIEDFLQAKDKIASKYDEGFKENSHLKKPAVITGTKHARHLYTIWVNLKKRDEYLKNLQGSGIGIAVNFRPIHLMSYYREKYGYCPGNFPNAEMIGSSTITIPFYPKLTNEELDFTISEINKIITE